MIYPKFPIERVNFLLNCGGLGDTIAALPAIRYVKDRHPHVYPIVWIGDYLYDFARNVLPDIEIRNYSSNKFYDESLAGRTTSIGWFTNLKTRMDVHAFCLLANEIPNDLNVYNYLQINLKQISIAKFNLPKKYVVMTCAFTAPVREFPPDYVNQVNDYCISKGYKIVFLGKKVTDAGAGSGIYGNLRKEIDYSKGQNLIDKTTLLEAAKIMANAQCVIGLDNGLGHVAACTQVPVVQGYTSVDPIHRMPYRNGIMGWNWFPVVPPEDHPERYFQSVIDFEFNIDFRFAPSNTDSLIRSLTPQKWIEQLEKIL